MMRWLRALTQPRREVAPAKLQTFDEQTGQIYTETTIAAIKPDNDWHHRFRSSGEWIESHWLDHFAKPAPLVKISRKNKSTQGANEFAKAKLGTRSLVDTATEVILQRVKDLSIEVLQDVPAVVLQKVWHQIRARHLLNFHVWQVFSSLLREHNDSLSLHRYQDQIKDPTSNLAVYTSPLASQSFEFLTFLSITTLFSVPDLVKLHTLHNLVALEIICVEKPNALLVTDRLIRSWSIATGMNGGLPFLRILKLWQHPLVTQVSLEYIGSFPSLAIYDVTGCGFDRQGTLKIQTAGWKPIVDANILQRLETACVERATLMRTTLDISSGPIQKSFTRQLSDEAQIYYIPRAQVPVFLAHDETVGQSGAQGDQTSNRPKHAAQSQTWESSIYMKICKIGELRNDGDLKRAGIEIGDQPIVGNELICPLPVVCLRLGPTPLSQLLCTDAFYSGSRFRDEFEDERPPTPVNRGRNGILESQRLAFMRIKYDKQELQPQQTLDGWNSMKRPASVGSRPTSCGEPASTKRRLVGLRKKKKAIGDILASFLP